MTLDDVRNLEWVEVKDWSGVLGTSSCGHIRESDIDNFVDNIFKDISRKLNISCEKLEPLLKKENSAFYSAKKTLFNTFKYGDILGEIDFIYDNRELLKLEKMLRVPNTLTIPKNMICNNVETVLDSFNSLSEIEKLEVLERLGVVSINIKLLSNN